MKCFDSKQSQFRLFVCCCFFSSKVPVKTSFLTALWKIFFFSWFIDAVGLAPVPLIANMRRDIAGCEYNYPHVKQFKHVTDVLHSFWYSCLFYLPSWTRLFIRNQNRYAFYSTVLQSWLVFFCLSFCFLKLHKYLQF